MFDVRWSRWNDEVLLKGYLLLEGKETQESIALVSPVLHFHGELWRSLFHKFRANVRSNLSDLKVGRVEQR